MRHGQAHTRRLIQVNLERAGYEAVLVQDAFAALEMARLAAPDLIILDFTLPTLNGGQVYERLQQDPLTWQIPVLVLGSRAADAGVYAAQDEQLHRLGVPALHKPFDPVHLLTVVTDLLMASTVDR